MSFIEQPAIAVAANSVTSAGILDGTIVNGDIANTTITGSKLVNDTITAVQIAANAITGSEITDNVVTFAKIQDLAGPGLIGRSVAGTGDPSLVQLGTNMQFSGSTLQTVTTPTFDNTRITGVASADVNTLDFYQEYTFTPTITGSTTAGVLTYNTTFTYGNAQRVGNRLFVQGRVIVTDVTTAPTGNLVIAGIPLVATQQTVISLVDVVKPASSTYTTVGGFINAGASTITTFVPYQSTTTLLDASTVEASTQFSFNFSMLVG